MALNKIPKLECFRSFSSFVYVHNEAKAVKLDAKSWEGISVSYFAKGYEVYYPQSNRFYLARDVVDDGITFLETRL